MGELIKLSDYKKRVESHQHRTLRGQNFHEVDVGRAMEKLRVSKTFSEVYEAPKKFQEAFALRGVYLLDTYEEGVAREFLQDERSLYQIMGASALLAEKVAQNNAGYLPPKANEEIKQAFLRAKHTRSNMPFDEEFFEREIGSLEVLANGVGRLARIKHRLNKSELF